MQPAWVRIVAFGMLALGGLLVVGTIVGGIMSESLGVTLACATAGPLGFGIVASIAAGRTRDAQTSGAAIGAPLGCGCAAGLVLFLMTAVFFLSIFPRL